MLLLVCFTTLLTTLLSKSFNLGCVKCADAALFQGSIRWHPARSHWINSPLASSDGEASDMKYFEICETDLSLRHLV